MSTVTLDIERLGAGGDGEATHDGTRVFVPYTLPGERVRAELDGERGQLTEIVGRHVDRIAPICRHFGTCGGCALQHAGPELYSAFKRERIITALASRGIDAEVDVLVPLATGTRRRATFAVVRDGEAVTLGYSRARSHDIVAIEECPILTPAITAALPVLRALALEALPRKAEARFSVTDTGSGLDVSLDDAKSEMTAKRRAALGLWIGGAATVLRLTIDGDEIAKRAEPKVTVAGHLVPLPAGAFLQATAASESALAKLVVEGLGKQKSRARIADLYAGLGALTLPIAAKYEALAVEWDAPAVAALTRAAREPGLRKIEVLKRDLAREPLSPIELKEFSAVVLDPPRAGAEPQAAALAKSSVPTVVMVSCNPATFARDASLLMDGGYDIGRVTPVDQFLYSAHVELVAVFRRLRLS